MRHRPIAGKCSAGYAAVALASLGAFFFALVLVASPGLHEHFHPDGAQPQHECAITVVEAGNELTDSAPALPLPQAAAQNSAVAVLRPVWVAAPFLSACIFEHAPPALS